jgi:Sulfotransferase family
MTDQTATIASASRTESGRRPVKVLYISGATRTSSTLLGAILNEIPGFFYIGELNGLWRIVKHGWALRCGCGELVRECPVWEPALQAQVPEGQTLETFAGEVTAWQASSFRARHTFALLRKSPEALRRDRAISGYLDLLTSTYERLRELTGARVLVDSSKAPAPAAGLTRAPGVESYVVHLVRDPRAVVYSWSQRKEGLERYGLVHSAVEWDGLIAASDAVVRRHRSASMVLRYEDFVEDPARSIGRILGLMGEDASSNPVHGRRVMLGPNHCAFGNPDRYRRGEVEISGDVRWKTGLSRFQRLAVTALTYPLMRRFGYG